MTETLRDRQLERERQQVENGIARYQKHRMDKDEGDMTPGKILVRRAIAPVMDAIDQMVADIESGKAASGRPAVAVGYLKHLQSGPVAYITARVCINAACTNDRLPKTAMALAAMIEEHYNHDELRSAEPVLANHMERKAKKWSTPHHRRTIMRLAAKAAGVTGLQWKQGDKLKLGLKLIELFIESTGLCEQVLVSEGYNRTQYILRPTPETSEWLEKMHGRCELLEPKYTPMVCVPRKWSNPLNGGYLTRENQVDFIGGISPELRDDAFSIDMDPVYDSVNAIQETPWRINKPVFEVLRTLWNAGETLADLPDQEWEPVPERPSDIPKHLPRDDMSPEMQKRFDDWRYRAATAHDRNAGLISKRMAVASKISMASDVKDEDAIYFPHNVDFRGRIYPIVPNLNPQADDIGKGLLEFAEGKPLGENGGYWLAVHIANLFGVDKVSFDERVEWVLANENKIADSAVNPLDGERFWTQADKPWCALAACFEWAGYRMTDSSYVSHLPIAMDGSCSGLQHFSAMLKDADGGREVNLTAAESPADIYTAVAAQVELSLNDPACATDQLAQAWRGKVSRKIVKRPCMTFAYSVTSRGMRDQIVDEMKKTGLGEYLPGYDNFKAATYLAPVVERAIRSTVDRAAEAMDWLKIAVRKVVEANNPVVWFTPLGFPVQHRYIKTNGKRFEVLFQGVRMQVQLRVDTKKQDMRKQQSGIAPNFVHSMDACHLMMVVNRMKDEGITSSFAMIHDSFGVHACDVDELHYAIRDEFINLYSVDQLEKFRNQVIAFLPADERDDVPPTPQPGSLDLEDIRAADFFFA